MKGESFRKSYCRLGLVFRDGVFTEQVGFGTQAERFGSTHASEALCCEWVAQRFADNIRE